MNNFYYSVIIICLAFMLVISRCSSCKDNPVKTDTSYQTVIRYEKVHDTVYGKPTLVYKDRAVVRTIYERDTLLIPSDGYEHLKRQYEGLIASLYSINRFQHTYPVDTIGTVKITDTVSENMITGRSLIFDLNYPVITNTVTITKPYEPKRQLYLGTGLSGSSKGIIDGARLSLLYKDRKDRMFDVGGRYNIQLNNYSIEAGTYWKIKL